MKNIRELGPLGIPPEKLSTAILSLLIELSADIDTINARLDQIQRDETPSDLEIYEQFRQSAWDNVMAELLSKFGE